MKEKYCSNWLINQRLVQNVAFICFIYDNTI